MLGEMLCFDILFEGGPYHGQIKRRVIFSSRGALLLTNPKSFMLPKLMYRDTGEEKEFNTQSYRIFKYIPNK